MTNYLPPELQKKKLLTPETPTIILPVFLAFFLAILFTIFGITPITLEKEKSYKALEIYRNKKRELPVLKENLRIVRAQLKNKQNQKTRLIELVAGKSELKTILSKLNELAIRNSVSITQVEPISEMSYDINSESDVPSENDPLVQADIERHSLQVTLRGTFPDLQSFLRKLESLEIIVLPINMNLFSITNLSDKSKIKTLDLKLNLAIYARSY